MYTSWSQIAVDHLVLFWHLGNTRASTGTPLNSRVPAPWPCLVGFRHHDICMVLEFHAMQHQTRVRNGDPTCQERGVSGNVVQTRSIQYLSFYNYWTNVTWPGRRGRRSGRLEAETRASSSRFVCWFLTVAACLIISFGYWVLTEWRCTRVCVLRLLEC